MSVTFSPEFVPHMEHKLVCACGAWNSETYASFDDARNALTVSNVTSECEDVYCYGNVFVEPAGYVPEVQMSNSNASMILDVLGFKVGEDFSERCCGSLDAEDLMGRILISQAVNPEDEGVESFTSGNIIDSGRPFNYTEGKLESLLDVAEYASARCLKICWG